MTDRRREYHLARLIEEERDRYMAEHPGEPGEPVYIICLACRPGVPLMFPDNLRAACAECGLAIQHRPKLPPGSVTVCMDCARKRLATEPDAARQLADVTARQLRRIRRETAGD